jgi:hypothetical protein
MRYSERQAHDCGPISTECALIGDGNSALHRLRCSFCVQTRAVKSYLWSQREEMCPVVVISRI